MAANYWASTQRRHWQFSKSELDDLRNELASEEKALIAAYPLPDLRHLSIYINQREPRPLDPFEVPMLTMVLCGRSQQTCETSQYPTAGNSNCAIICAPLLSEGRDPAYKSISSYSNGGISRL